MGSSHKGGMAVSPAAWPGGGSEGQGEGAWGPGKGYGAPGVIGSQGTAMV